MGNGGRCPRCEAHLGTGALLEGARIEVEVCPRCRGIWFDAGELEEALAAARTEDARVDRGVLDRLAERHDSAEPVRYLKCPVCGSLMNRSAYGLRSGVVVDFCREHGVWLDGGELERLRQWVAAGGHVLHARVAEERRGEEARREAQRRRSAVALGPLDDGEDLLGGPSDQEECWLVRVLGDLIDTVR
jgi:Zn-finger nucleic acid-binding protein